MSAMVYSINVTPNVPSQEFDYTSFTPQALLVFMTNQTSTGGKDNTAASLSMGMSAGGVDHCSSVGTDAGEWTFDQRAVLINLIDKDGTVLARGTLREFNTTGFIVDWSVQPTSRYYLHFVAMGSALGNLTAAKVTRGNAANTSFSLTGAGFTPDFAMGMHGHSNTYPTSISDTTTASFGFWMDDSVTRAGGGTDRINDASNGASMAVRTTNCVTRWRDDTRARITAWDADGATWTSSLTGAMDVQAMFFDNASFNFSADTVVVNAAGDVSETTGFEPELVWVLSSGQNAGDDFDQGYGGWCIGFGDGSRQFCIFIGQDDDSPHNTGIRVETNRIAVEPGAGYNLPGSFESLNVTLKSLNATSFTLTVNQEGSSRVVHTGALSWGDGPEAFGRGIIFADGIVV